MAEKLALFGGAKTIPQIFPRNNSIGKEEAAAVQAVMETGVLSQFLGSWDPDFYGGERVRQFEKDWQSFFQVKHAVTVNSNTSGLMCALGAIGLEPGDEVIVSPWTMCASATAILIWNAIPVFADIEEETFCLDPKSIEKNISARTKAIVVTDIFGHPARLDEIMAIAKKHNLKVIEDAAQVPGAKYHGRYAGTIGDIGVFSLNYHKHIHTGEGGVCVTNDAELAERMQLIRNHGEAVVAGKGVARIDNIIGFNFRMGELEAAIGIEQLKKLNKLIASRRAVAKRLSEGLAGLSGLITPVEKSNCDHIYYIYGMKLNLDEVGVSRDRIVEAIAAEGVPIAGRYCNIHLLPIYQKKLAYGRGGFPWHPSIYKGEVSYKKGICPVAEDLQDHRYLGLEVCAFTYTNTEVDLVIAAFRKVWQNLPSLR